LGGELASMSLSGCSIPPDEGEPSSEPLDGVVSPWHDSYLSTSAAEMRISSPIQKARNRFDLMSLRIMLGLQSQRSANWLTE